MVQKKFGTEEEFNIMNYRLLLTEMLIDYRERQSLEKCQKRKSVYSEIINDLKIALDIEPNQISIIQEANKIIQK